MTPELRECPNCKHPRPMVAPTAPIHNVTCCNPKCPLHGANFMPETWNALPRKSDLREACEILEWAMNYDWEGKAGCAEDGTLEKIEKIEAFIEKHK